MSGATEPTRPNYGACAQEPQLLSPRATTTEPLHTRACAPREKPLQWEAHTPQLESSAYSLQLEKNLCKQQRPSTAKNKK